MTQPVETTAYPCPKGVNVADSVTLKLSPTNYFAWKQLMLEFLDSQELSGFVDGTINTPNNPSSILGQGWKEVDKEEELKRRRDWDQKHMQQLDWKMSSGEHLLRWTEEQERREKWEQEHERQGREWEMEQARRVMWETEWKEENESQEEQKRREVWNQERERRRQWNQQRELREEEIKYTGWKKSDGLVRGWILATLTEEILLQVIDLVTARDVWIKLIEIFTQPSELCHFEPIDWTYKDRGHIVSQYAELHKAALTNDWETAAKFLDQEPNAMYLPITWCSETALTVAVRSGKRNSFVMQLMDKMERDSLAQEAISGATALYAEVDISGATALHAAVDVGNIEAAKWLVGKNSELANVKDKYGTLAVHVAAGLGKREMVNLLLEHTTTVFENKSGLKLLHCLASSGLYDIALAFLQHNPKLASMEPSPLVVMAQKRTSFPSGNSLNWNFLQRLIYFGIPLKLEYIANHPQERDIENPAKCVVSAPIYVKQKLNAMFWDVTEILVPPIKSVRETKLTHHKALNLVKCLCEEVVKFGLQNAAKIFTEPLRNSACLGIHEIVEEILVAFPSAIHLRSENNQSIFHLAILYRRENVFNLIYQMEDDRLACALLSMPDALSYNALHSAGNLAEQQKLLLRAMAPGAALQMQRELQWFKEIGKFVTPQAKEHMNAYRKTPQEVFTETHKDLVKEGEQWMKDTANSCTIVAALITTIVFAAAITVPGGSFSDVSSEKSGLPIRLGDGAFTWFGISDALALFSSSASLLMFLSILTCHYGE